MGEKAKRHRANDERTMREETRENEKKREDKTRKQDRRCWHVGYKRTEGKSGSGRVNRRGGRERRQKDGEGESKREIAGREKRGGGGNREGKEKRVRAVEDKSDQAKRETSRPSPTRGLCNNSRIKTGRQGNETRAKMRRNRKEKGCGAGGQEAGGCENGDRTWEDDGYRVSETRKKDKGHTWAEREWERRRKRS